MNKTRTATFLALTAAVALAAGCASPRDRYYSLAPAPELSTPAAASGLLIDVAPVVVPERLARPQMLVRRSAASPQLDLLDQHLWSSSFENELRDAIAIGVAGQLGAVNTTGTGKTGAAPVWRIAVQLQQFDAVEGSRVDAAFGWTLKRSDAERVLRCRWNVSQPVEAGIDALAAGVKTATARAAQAIALQIGALQIDPATACLAVAPAIGTIGPAQPARLPF